METNRHAYIWSHNFLLHFQSATRLKKLIPLMFHQIQHQTLLMSSHTIALQWVARRNWWKTAFTSTNTENDFFNPLTLMYVNFKSLNKPSMLILYHVDLSGFYVDNCEILATTLKFRAICLIQRDTLIAECASPAALRCLPCHSVTGTPRQSKRWKVLIWSLSNFIFSYSLSYRIITLLSKKACMCFFEHCLVSTCII